MVNDAIGSEVTVWTDKGDRPTINWARPPLVRMATAMEVRGDRVGLCLAEWVIAPKWTEDSLQSEHFKLIPKLQTR